MQQLPKIIHDKLLPWAKAGAADRIIVARPRMTATNLPSDVQLTHRKIQGKRIVLKGKRSYGNIRYISAKWPEDDMDETVISRFICVIEGKVHFRAGDYMLECKQGDFILVPPGLPFYGGKPSPELLGIPDGSSLLLWMIAYRHGFHCWLEGYGSFLPGGPTENYLLTSGQLVQIYELLIEETLGRKDGPLCDSLLFALVRALSKEIEDKRYLHPGPIVSMESSPVTKGELIERLKIYVEQHLNEHLTLDIVARHLHVSRTQLVRYMRQETGQTFVEFLTQCRIKEAQTLLRETEWTAQLITEFVGLKSSAYFHALFLRQVGCTPGEFRLKAQKK